MSAGPEELVRHVDTASGRMRYYEAGAADRHPVLLLHGSGPGATGWSNFSNNIDFLARDFRVLAVDMPGWGGSDPVTNDRLDHVQAAIDFLDAIGVDRASFVGNSMGGQTSIRLATEHPERMTHLVTMGPPIGPWPSLFAPNDGPSEGLKALVGAYADPSATSMRKLVEIMCFDKAGFATEALCEERSQAALANPVHLKNYLEGLRQRGPIPQWARLDLLPQITVPTLLIHGRDDRVVSFETSLVLLSAIPDSRLVLMNRCGHWAMIEHADEFNRLVRDFIANT